MKSFLPQTLLAIVCLLCSITASAHDFLVGGIYYDFSPRTGEVAVVNNNDQYNSYSGTVVIPETVSYKGVTYEVTEIYYDAFRESKKLTSVTLPNTISYIRPSAFQDCTALKTVSIDSSSNLYRIENWAFEGCTSLRSINIPDKVKEINAWAFAKCSNLASVSIGKRLETIESKVFYKCTALTSIIIPDNVKKIEGHAFDECTSLTTVTIGKNIEEIGNYAFSLCDKLMEINMEGSVPPSIGENSIYQKYTAQIYVPIEASNTYRSAPNWRNLNINKYLVDGVYYNILSKNEVETTFKNRKSYYYSGDVNISDNVTINDVKYDVIQVGDSTFYKCENLTSVRMPQTIKTIKSGAFRECANLYKIHCEAVTPPQLYWDAFSDYEARLYVPSLSGGAYRAASFWECFDFINNYLIDGIYYDTISDNEVKVTYCDTNFNSYSDDVVIPNTVKISNKNYDVTVIGDSAFFNSVSLKSITLPESLTLIGKLSFACCERLRSVSIPDNVEEICTGAFGNCTSLREITLGSNLEVIDAHAFYECDYIGSIVAKPLTPPIIYYLTFMDSAYKNATLTVPEVALEDYKNDIYWKEFSNIITSDAGVNDVLQDDLQIKVVGNSLQIINQRDEAYVKIFNINGVLLHDTVVANLSNIKLSHGVYLIQVEDIVNKITI